MKPTREEFRRLAAEANLIPVYTELVSDTETPVSAFKKLDTDGYAFLLESAETSDQVGRYSFVGTNPRLIVESQGRRMKVTGPEGVREFDCARDPLEELRSLMSRYRPVSQALSGQDLPVFTGGAVGYMAYDVVRFFEPTIGEPAKDELQLPETVFMITDTVLIFDHRLRRLRILSNALVQDDPDVAYDEAERQIAEIIEKLSQPARLPQFNALEEAEISDPRSNTTRAEYLQMVEDAKEYIRAGDIFQIVPSQRFETEFAGDPLTLYRALRFVNPSPYLFCLKFAGRFALVGSSPEVHVRAMNGKVEIRPIAGTRRRGANETEDEANAKDLLNDPKERAEHLMLVDLARNDVGRIAKFGTVEVTDFMTIERYSHVMHIVSNVVGTLRDGSNAYEVMRATFPAGTVSGSPKVRAMQLINQFEKSKRNSYAGVVGYFGFDGNLDSCIALRTAVLKDSKVYFQAGGGVVADSTPEGEYQETVNKAMAMMTAIAKAKKI